MRFRDRIAVGAGATALATSVLALGGAPRWGLVAVSLAVGVAVASQVTSRRRMTRVSPLLALIGGAAGLTALQLVPLPEAVLATLNPTGHELIAARRALLGESGWMPLSLDPANTRRELLELLAYLAVAWVALRLAVTDIGRLRVLGAVALACGGAAALGAIHHIVGATALYGLYTPHRATPAVLAPLLNSNHFACLLVLGAAVSGGLALHDRQSVRARGLWVVIGLGCIVLALQTHSRGGVAALAAGATVFGVAVAVQRLTAGNEKRRPHTLRVTVPAVVFVTCTLISVVMISASGGVRRDLEETSTAELDNPRSKYVAWQSSLRLIEETPWVGVGRGAFEPAFTRIHAASAHHTFSHLENEYLQTVVDWGLPGAALLAVALGWLAIVAIRRLADGPLAAGALAGAAAVATQSVVDFGLEMPGLAVPTTLVLATLAYVPLREGRAAPHVVGLRAGLVAGLVGLSILVSVPGGRTVHDDHLLLTAQLRPTLEPALDAMSRHPLDYLAPAYAAQASAADPGKAIGYLNNALTLHPTHPDLHRIVARLLVHAGRPIQARLEYRLAFRGVDRPERLLEEIVRVFPDAETASQAIPPDHRNIERLVRALTKADHTDVAFRYLEHVVEHAPHDPLAWQLLFDQAELRKDTDAAIRAARRRAALAPSVAATTVLGRILVRTKKLVEADAALAGVERLPGATGEQVAARLLQCDVAIERAQWQRARECLSAMREAPAVRPEVRRQMHAKMARIETELGNARRAEWERKQAQTPP